MCGIAGMLNFDRAEAVSESRVRTMCDAIRHRGPDDDGYYIDQNLGMGMRRLRILDLEGGKQPIFNEDGTVAVVFNGEIYNYLELRRELEGKGHTFRTHSDTESIVHLYEEEGEDCVRKLRGMFAFAIFDTKNRKLFIARDRLGKKPLFYLNDGKRLVFGSELKCITALNEFRLDMDLETLESYFGFGYIPGPRSIYKQVLKLPAGHTMSVRDGQVTLIGRASNQEEAARIQKVVQQVPGVASIKNELLTDSNGNLTPTGRGTTAPESQQPQPQSTQPAPDSGSSSTPQPQK